jgi:hypothetical protein
MQLFGDQAGASLTGTLEKPVLGAIGCPHPAHGRDSPLVREFGCLSGLGRNVVDRLLEQETNIRDRFKPAPAFAEARRGIRIAEAWRSSQSIRQVQLPLQQAAVDRGRSGIRLFLGRPVQMSYWVGMWPRPGHQDSVFIDELLQHDVRQIADRITCDGSTAESFRPPRCKTPNCHDCSKP